jgi:hypothetical protein
MYHACRSWEDLADGTINMPGWSFFHKHSGVFYAAKGLVVEVIAPATPNNEALQK